MRAAWTVIAVLVGGYIGYVLGVLILSATGTTLTAAHLQAVGGPCAIIAAVLAGRGVWVWRRN